MVSGQHSKATPRWGTPADIVERARRVIGRIDLDPCSEPAFNEVVKAGKIYTADDNGLIQPWLGRVLCNPPGGLVREFWRKAMDSDLRQMIWIGFSVEQLCLLADEEYHPTDFTMCYLRKRISFIRHDGYVGSPSHGNYICGVGVDSERFRTEFGELGLISHLNESR